MQMYHLHGVRLDNIAKRLDRCGRNQSALQFELAQQLLHNKHQPFQLRDVVTNQQILTPDGQSEAIRVHYNAFYNQPNYISPPMFIPAATPFVPVTPAEVQTAIRRLTNGRTHDSDQLYGEYFKYSGPILIQPICSLINTIFISQTPLHITQVSQLFCLNKPKLVATVTNLRPLTLMSIMRKIM